ncbi:MAG: restriction endonuclease subunit S [Candidatus Accumulibacter cognatus]|uniref:Restriction endonuclease subunit S n=1 Tax=Candidatus Accumulibacter cognatus TaxID=2954383 RepID=A0A7D5SV49_9PROT|nr:MAG: restriction endonuclease subunit S [Candidatus Accumulibacter cognatus]
MSVASRNHCCLDDFTARGALKIQNGFPCGNWNDKGVGVLQLRPFNVTDGGQIDLSSAKFIETDKKLDSYLLRNGDVIFNNTNSEALVGKTAYWARSESAVLSNHMTILRVLDQEALNGQFLAFYLLLKWYDGHFHSICQRHVNQASVGKDRLGATVLPRIELPEQKKIAHILSTVQRAIEAQERIIQTTTELKKALMHKLFTEGLRNEPQKQTEIGPVPESWEVVELENVCELIVDCPHTTPKFLSEGVRVARNFNIRDGRFVSEPAFFTSEEQYQDRVRRAVPQAGDVLFSREAPVGEACVIPDATRLSLGQRTMLIRTDRNRLIPDFLVYSFYSPVLSAHMKSIASGLTVAHLNVADVRKLPLPLPSLSVQVEIAQALLYRARSRLNLLEGLEVQGQ